MMSHRLGESVFGVVPSSRGANSGCVVVSAHYQSRYSVAYALRLALHLTTRKATIPLVRIDWLSHLLISQGLGRDVIFLFTDNSTSGAITKWLHFYYADHGNVGPAHFRRSGPVLQALHLDFAGPLDSTRKVVLALEGSQLPNLDLLNAFVATCTQRGIDRRHILTARRFSHPAMKRFPPTFAFFLQFFINQFCGGAGAHAEYNAFAADSMTVASISGPEAGVSGAALSDCIEGSLRGLLSIQEPLHQSFYFYLLPSATQYISIGHYMILFGLVSVVVVVALGILVLDPQFVKTLEWDWRLVLLPAALLNGAAMWWLPMNTAAYFALLAAAVAQAVLLRQSPGNVGTAVAAFAAIGAALTVCSLVNFAVAVVGSVLTVWHLFCWWISQRTRTAAVALFGLLDPLCLASLTGLLFQVRERRVRAWCVCLLKQSL